MKINDKIILYKKDFLYKHPALFAVLVWENEKCEVTIHRITKDTYIVAHNNMLIEIPKELLND